MTLNAPETISRDFLLKGPAADFYQYEGREGLLEGGTRTSKSWSLLIKAKMCADLNPGSRQLICRQTRKSLNESILKDWREEILWIGHPAVSSSATKEHQDLYRWKNGSEVFFTGLEQMRDTSSPILSTKWDRVYIVQAEETQQSDWELLATRLSSFKTPYHQLTADCNPAAPSHWLNTRFGPDRLGKDRQRFPFRHYDNPFFYTGIYPDGEWTKEGAEYISILEGTLTGIRRDRFLLHKWVAAEGQILDNWDPRIHSIDASIEHDERHGWLIHIPGVDNPIRVAYFTAGVDWGWSPDPGAMSLWAYDSPRWHPLVRRFRVAEVMKLKWQREEWAALAEDWYGKYGVSWFSCDPSDPENINYFKIRLGKKNYRNAPPIAIKCPPIGGGHQRSKNKTAQIDLMREGLMSATGHTRTFLFKDAFPEGIDEELRRVGLPTCYEQEIESWVYELDAQGNATEKPSRKHGQHANACFVAGTKILTSRGQIPIEEVMIGDRVLVPYEDEVIALWESEEEEEVLDLVTPCGMLRGTGNHPLWTTLGWKRLDETAGERLLLLGQKRSATMGLRGIATRSLAHTRRAITSLARFSRGASSFIGTSGSARSVRERLGSTSTIATKTAETTPDLIWRSSRHRPIEEGIRSFRWPMLGGENGFRIHAIPSSYLGTHGRVGRGGLPDHELAEYADECLQRGRLIPGSECAPTYAGSSIGGTLIPVITTASGLLSAGKARVFTLTVKNSARYIANGFMVANCYAAMYDETLSFVRGFGKQPMTTSRANPGTMDALIEELERERDDDNRKKGKRRGSWE